MVVALNDGNPPFLWHTPTPHLSQRTTPVRKWKLSTWCFLSSSATKTMVQKLHTKHHSTFQWLTLHWPWPNHNAWLLLTSPRASTTKVTSFPNAATPSHIDLVALAASINAIKPFNYCNYGKKEKMMKMTMIMTPMITIDDKDHSPPLPLEFTTSMMTASTPKVNCKEMMLPTCNCMQLYHTKPITCSLTIRQPMPNLCPLANQLNATTSKPLEPHTDAIH